MKKLTHIAMALANNTLSKSAMTLVKGGADNNGNPSGNQVQDPANPANVANMQDEEKRRQRPGGGSNTN